jgi:condensin complex subunit 1
MCVSSDYCESHLQLLFTILEKSKNPAIRSNLVIALGDMAVCFSTLIDENISFLYNRLSDEDTLVKKNALMVLTHLILNGMVKIKGQIAEMAKCLEDPEPRISDLAKLFFSELASKDNAIYNNLPDIISSLSNPETRIEEEPFRKIMKFLFSFDFAEKVRCNVYLKSTKTAPSNLITLFYRKSKQIILWTNYAYAIKTVMMRGYGGT